jgi:hypothetical protein
MCFIYTYHLSASQAIQRRMSPVLNWENVSWRILNFYPKNLSGGAEETYGDPRLVHPVSKPKAETRTSRIRSRNAVQLKGE